VGEPSKGTEPTGRGSLKPLGRVNLFLSKPEECTNKVEKAQEISIAKHTKVDMIWIPGCSPTFVSHSLRGVAMNLKATTLTYPAIVYLILQLL